MNLPVYHKTVSNISIYQKKYSISASFSLFKNTMSSKDTSYLITTLHHSFIESKLTYFKTKAV